MGSSSRLRRRPLRHRFGQCLRVSLAFLFSQVGLLAVVVAYSAAGAVLFAWLEADQELEPRRKILRLRTDCLGQLRNLSSSVASDEHWMHSAASFLKAFESDVVQAVKLEGYDGKEVDDAERQWSVSGALLYSITVITTIGYGNLVPKTGPGKLATIVYALIGIPLMLMCLSNLGSLMAGSFQFAFHQLARCCPSCPRRRRFRPPPPPQPQPSNAKQDDHPVSTIVPIVVSKPAADGRRADQQQHHEADKVALDDGRRSGRRHSQLRRQERVVISDAELSECDYDTVPGVNVKEPLPTIKVTPPPPPPPPPPPGEYGLERLTSEACGVLDRCRRYNAKSALDSASSPSPSVVGAPRLDPLLVEKLLASAVPLERPEPTPPRTSPVRLAAPVVPPANSRKKPVPVVIVLAFLVGYICLGAVVFSAWEEWTYLDGAYFSFITLSTIGFGDLVPGSKVLEQGHAKLVACIVYLVFGLAVIAMSFNLVQEEVVARFRKLGQALGILDEK